MASASWALTERGVAIVCSTPYRTPTRYLPSRDPFKASINLKEFFLLLSSTGLAYRRCELVRVNGTEIDVQFLKGKNKKKKTGAARRQDAVVGG
jgi:hypothetical protein